MRLRLLTAVTLFALCGCGKENADMAHPAGQMVFVDLQTLSPIVSEQSDLIPAVHPVTGERSLMPGLYCNTCGKWHPSPPLEELQRNPQARQCPQCAGALSADGPWPGE